LNQAADAETTPGRCFARHKLGRAEEERQVLVERAENQRNGGSNSAQNNGNKYQSSVAWLHTSAPASRSVARSLPWPNRPSAAEQQQDFGSHRDHRHEVRNPHVKPIHLAASM
jgi:hypothetical protein